MGDPHDITIEIYDEKIFIKVDYFFEEFGLCYGQCYYLYYKYYLHFCLCIYLLA